MWLSCRLDEEEKERKPDVGQSVGDKSAKKENKGEILQRRKSGVLPGEAQTRGRKTHAERSLRKARMLSFLLCTDLPVHHSLCMRVRACVREREIKKHHHHHLVLIYTEMMEELSLSVQNLHYIHT